MNIKKLKKILLKKFPQLKGKLVMLRPINGSERDIEIISFD